MALLAPHPIRLEMVCTKCTRSQEFTGVDRVAAVQASIRYGWVVRDNNAICKRCPAYRERAEPNVNFVRKNPGRWLVKTLEVAG